LSANFSLYCIVLYCISRRAPRGCS